MECVTEFSFANEKSEQIKGNKHQRNEKFEPLLTFAFKFYVCPFEDLMNSIPDYFFLLKIPLRK